MRTDIIPHFQQKADLRYHPDEVLPDHNLMFMSKDEGKEPKFINQKSHLAVKKWFIKFYMFVEFLLASYYSSWDLRTPTVLLSTYFAVLIV